MRQFPLIVSYYTDDDVYRPAAERLEASLKRLGLEYAIERVERFGDWGDHANLKANIILEAMQKHNRPIFWTDADNEFLEYPKLLENMTTDVGLARFYRWDYELSTAVIYFDGNAAAENLLTTWMRMNERKVSNDQTNFHRAVQAHIQRGLISVSMIPWSYYQSPTIEVKDLPAVIWQHQASREGRAYVSSPA